MHRTRGVLIRNFGRRQDPGLDELRLELYTGARGESVKRYFMAFLFDEAGFGEPTPENNWIGYNYF